MDKTPRPTSLDEVRFYQVPNVGCWVFAGCRNPAGYATREAAETEAKLQLGNLYVGPLNTGDVEPADHRKSVRVLRQLR